MLEPDDASHSIFDVFIDAILIDEPDVASNSDEFACNDLTVTEPLEDVSASNDLHRIEENEIDAPDDASSSIFLFTAETPLTQRTDALDEASIEDTIGA